MARQPNIAIASVGTRGDIQPYCILAKALQARGCKVTIVTEQRLEPLVTKEYNLDCRIVHGDVGGVVYQPEAQRRLRTGNFFEIFAIVDEYLQTLDTQEAFKSYIGALKGADIIISGLFSLYESYIVAEKTRAIWIPVLLGVATIPTTAFPHWALEDYTFGFKFLNKWTHRFPWSLLWSKHGHIVNMVRQQVLGLQAMDSAMGVMDNIIENNNIVLYQATSKLLFKELTEEQSEMTYFQSISSWLFGYEDEPNATGKVEYIGFLFPAAQEGSSKLKEFIAADTKSVIYIGFGSMPTLEPLPLLEMIVDICQKVQCRCIFGAGWSAMAVPEVQSVIDANKDLVFVETGSLSHMWLFPQMHCIVHHAGIGTTGAALKSGVPQIPCPVLCDQFSNANKLVSLGVAPCVAKGTQMNSEYLSSAIQNVLNNENDICSNAKQIGERLTEECHNSAERLCDLILKTKPTFRESA